jgi:hypothetical protein
MGISNPTWANFLVRFCTPICLFLLNQEPTILELELQDPGTSLITMARQPSPLEADS